MKNLNYHSFSSSPCLIVLILLNLYQYLTYTEGFDTLLQLPQTRMIMRTRPRSQRVLHLHDFGAKGDGITNDTQAIKDAWEAACSFSSRTTIVIPAGYTYLVHPIDFAGSCKSKVTLTISGTIVAPKDPNVWDGLNSRKWLYFHGVKHLTIDGGGTINGMGRKWWARSCKTNTTNPCRHAPTAITFHRCKNLKFRNLMIINSQQMHIAFTNCIRVVASFLKVFAPHSSPNTDGIHISASTGVEVKDSVIRTGDDCISIVKNSSRIRIRNIACGPGHGISIGSLGKSNSWEKVHDITVDTAFLSNTENGVRIKTWQGGGGSASEITFQNVWMENVTNPIIIDQYYCDSLLPCLNQTLSVKVENISFIGIKGTSASDEAIRFVCSDNAPCQGLYLENIQLISQSGEDTQSFCWQAQGSSSGLVYPHSCLSSNKSFIEQNVSYSSSFLQSF